MTQPDMINSPTHYKTGGIEVIDFIEAKLGLEGALAFCHGNVIKYMARSQHKGNFLEDIKKAEWYLKRAISIQERLDAAGETST